MLDACTIYNTVTLYLELINYAKSKAEQFLKILAISDYTNVNISRNDQRKIIIITCPSELVRRKNHYPIFALEFFVPACNNTQLSC